MSGYSDDLTEEKLRELEGRIDAVYRQAYRDLDREVRDYFVKFEKRDAEMRELVEAREFSKEEYRRWRMTQIGRGQRFEALRDKMAQRFTDANTVANRYVNDMTPGIYALNRNYEAYRIEQAVGNCDFVLLNESTVRRMIVEQPNVMPYYPPERALRRGIDLAYGKDQITKRVTSGILRGLSPGKIAAELMLGVTGMSRESALRAARTGITAAQNAGRMDSFVAAEKIGIRIRRRWVCAKDLRTRDAHALADGQTVEGVDTPFDVGGEKLMFPGDTSRGASGWNIYNCRCGMRTVEKDGIEAEPRQMRVRNPVTGKNELVNEMTYQEWRAWKNSLANSTESDRMKIGLQFFAKIPEEKFTSYALNPVKDANKARAFREALGYTLDNYKDLAANIDANIDESKFVEKGDSGHGMRYEFIMELTGPNGKKANVLTAWIQEGGEKRMTSVYVTKRSVTK